MWIRLRNRLLLFGCEPFHYLRPHHWCWCCLCSWRGAACLCVRRACLRADVSRICNLYVSSVQWNPLCALKQKWHNMMIRNFVLFFYFIFYFKRSLFMGNSKQVIRVITRTSKQHGPRKTQSAAIRTDRAATITAIEAMFKSSFSRDEACLLHWQYGVTFSCFWLLREHCRGETICWHCWWKLGSKWLTTEKKY